MAQTHEQFAADMAARQLAVTVAGWQGNAARMLVLRGDTPAAFDGYLAKANTIRALANMVKNQLADAGVDVENAIEQSIIHDFPLAAIRLEILARLAEHDEATHTDTAQPSYKPSPAGDVYAQRKAEAAQHGRR